MSSSKRLLQLLAAAFAFSLAACSDGDSPAATPTPESTITPTATATLAPLPPATETPSSIAAPSTPMYYPSSTRTGIAELDPVLDALSSGDAARMIGLFELTPSPCVVKPLGIQNPPACPEDVAAGTLLPVFRASAGEAVWPDALEQLVTNWLARPHGLYAAYRDPQIANAGWIPGADFAVVLADLQRTAEPWFASEIRVTDGRVVAIRFGGSLGAESYVEGISNDRLVLPSLPGWLAELPPNVRAVASAVSAGDGGALGSMLHFRPPLSTPTGYSIFMAMGCQGGKGLETVAEAVDALVGISANHGALIEAARANEDVQTPNLVFFLTFRVPGPGNDLRTVVVDDVGVIAMYMGCNQNAAFFAGNGNSTIWR